jgi:hypothetical protein
VTCDTHDMSIAACVPMISLYPVRMITAGVDARFVGSRVDPERVIVTKYMPETN